MTIIAPGVARLLSSRGRSAIAVIEIRGDLSRIDSTAPLFRAANGRSIDQQTLGAICFGVWGYPGEDIVLCRIAADHIEMTCHGGDAAIARILNDLGDRGYECSSDTSDGQAGHLSLDQGRNDTEHAAHREFYDCLLQARTQRTAEILLNQAQGQWERWRVLVQGSSQPERNRLITQMRSWREFGKHLTEPWRVVIYGRPNAGKSSLMNALAGYTRSIVSETPGTTRDRVTWETAIDGWPVQITDTAGVRDSDDPIESQGIARSQLAIQTADLIVIVLDSTTATLPEDYRPLQTPCHRQLIISHKSDLPTDDSFVAPPRSLRVSSMQGDGIPELLDAISAALVPLLPPEGQAIPITPSQLAELDRLILSESL